MERYISIAHNECIGAFQALFWTLQQPTRHLLTPEDNEYIRNEFGRYKVWAGNVGAGHQGPAYRLSLDYRLKDASFYRDRVLELLADLHTTLQRVTSILNGESLPFDEQQDPSQDTEPSTPDDLSDDSSETDTSDGSVDAPANLKNVRALVAKFPRKPTDASSESAHVKPAGKPAERGGSETEVTKARDAIKDIVTSLYKISTVIRRPLPSDRNIKSTETNVQHFAEFDQRYVSDKFPDANAEVIARLARGITRRRQLLKYRELHNKRLEVAVKSELLELKDIISLQRNQLPGGVTQTETKKTIVGNNINQVPSSDFVPSTKATTFVPRNPEVIEEVQSVADTASSYQSTSSGREIVRIPPRPRDLDGEEIEDFECPYCHVLCEIRSFNAWKQHILRDLEPYMCTFPKCSKPDRLYGSRLDWYQHELEEHRVEWFCNTEGHSSYQNQHDFKQHLANDHASSLPKEHLATLVHGFRRPLMEEGTPCSLCGNIPKSMQTHLARHQAQLALFAIPRRNYSDGESEINSTTSGHGLGRGSKTANSDDATIEESVENGSSDKNSRLGVSEDLADTTSDIIQSGIPDCEDEEWNLPANPDGTDYWLNTKNEKPGHQQGQSNSQVDKSSDPPKMLEYWAEFFKVTEDQLEGVAKEEIIRQNELHDIVVSEENYLRQINVLRVLYRDDLASWYPPVIAPHKLAKFISSVFGKVEAIKDVNDNYLLSPIKLRQKEQGPWITGFSDIFREWIRRARTPYIEYAAGFPYSMYSVRREAERNLLFRQFLEQARDNKLSNRSDWSTTIQIPLIRLQNYSLLLGSIQKKTQDVEEKEKLAIAIEEIKSVTLECDAKLDEFTKKLELTELNNKLFLRPGMKVELNLNHLGREVIFRGDLQRHGKNRFTWLDTHAILFDHYLVLAKAVAQKSGPGQLKEEAYDVSKLPIPVQLLVLENLGDPVSRNVARGIISQLSITRSKSSGHNIPREAAPTDGQDIKLLYPFTIKQLGKSEVYILYAASAENRQEWYNKILLAKTRHAAALYEQNAEPFRLRVMTDVCFQTDDASRIPQNPMIIGGTPLDRALRDTEREYGPKSVRFLEALCKAQVNCATTFSCYGSETVIIGTDYGAYISNKTNPREWQRAAIPINKITQIAVLEEFSLCLILADKALISYHLSEIVPAPDPEVLPEGRYVPQKLSGSRDVSFFAIARMKDRSLVFYKKREGLHSAFKVLEPKFIKAEQKSRNIFGRTKGTNPEFFREFDEFYIPEECTAMNIFSVYIAIVTLKGFDLLTLDKKVPTSLPDLKNPAVAAIASRLQGQRPLGMYRLSDVEFMLCYEECAVYVDKHGEVSRSVILEFVGRAKKAALYRGFLVLFHDDFVEIRNPESGRLRQIIAAGSDSLRCLDDGVNPLDYLEYGASTSQKISAASSGKVGRSSLKFVMAHPEVQGYQLVLEMVLDEGQGNELEPKF